MPKVIISPYSRKLRNGKNNPKNYPFWPELIKRMREVNIYVVQVGVTGEEELEGVDETKLDRSLPELAKLLAECDMWLSVDNFFQHFAYVNNKQGIVLFGQSDPKIFGHKENINLVKDSKYFRKLPFDIWERADYITECFVEPSVVIERITKGA